MNVSEWLMERLSSNKRKYAFNELAKIFPGNHEELKNTVREQLAQGNVLVSKRGKLFLPGSFGIVKGRIDVKRSGFAFVIDKQGDIFVPSDKKGGAINGDIVAVKIIQDDVAGKRREGAVVSIIEKTTSRVVGTLSGRFVIPDDDRIEEIFISKSNSGGAKAGQKVVVDIIERANATQNAQGNIIEVLGAAGEPNVELKSVIRSYELPETFPSNVVREAERVALKRYDIKGREDFRLHRVFTIDGADAKDLDDAVSIQKTNSGYSLGVHIADVSSYVQEGSDLDKEAFKRGTSVYLANSVLPMLPKALSNGSCSLNEGEERLTLSCIMQIDEQGNVQSARVCESVILSKHRLTYSDVEKLLTGGYRQLEDEYADIVEDIRIMGELASKMRVRREDKGSIDFDIAETEFSYGSDGQVISIKPKERTAAEKLIEEFMLAANKAVAQMYFWREIPFVYRVHEPPDEEKMHDFAAFYSNYGKLKGRSSNVHPKTLQGVLKDIKGKPYESIVSQVLLRSLKKAEYSSECKGHYGLAFDHYCHFTSPIRRYPDLAVHRIIKLDLAGKLQNALDKLAAKTNVIALQSSRRERNAMEAERAVDDIKRAEFMRGKEGRVYDAVVSGVAKNVIFVQLDNTVEGVLPLASLRDDYYVYMDKLHCVIAERTRQRISLGDAIRVRLMNVCVYPPRIEFERANKSGGVDERSC